MTGCRQLLLALIAGFAVFAALPGNAHASNDVSVIVSLTPTDVRVAEPFEFKISVRCDVETAVLMPDFDVDMIEVLSVADQEESDDGGARRVSRRWRLESYRSGELTIPALKVIVGVETKRTEPTTIHVVGELGDDAIAGDLDPKWIREPRPLRDVTIDDESDSTIERFALPAIGLAILLPIAVLIFTGVRSRTEGRRLTRQTVNRLTELQSRSGEGSANEFASQFSSIMRRHIERRFDIPALSSTAVETTESLGRLPQLTASQMEDLSQWLSECERMEFGGGDASSDQRRTWIDDAIRWVQSTGEVR